MLKIQTKDHLFLKLTFYFSLENTASQKPPNTKILIKLNSINIYKY